jgi:hypothetical protein
MQKKIILLYHESYLFRYQIFNSKNIIKIHENDVMNKHVNAKCKM